MSSAPARILPILGRILRGVAWTVLLALLAVSGAGLVGQTFHAPGNPARAELTWAGDTEVNARLDAAAAQLTAISADVGTLAQDAKTALSEVTSADPTRLRAALDDGNLVAADIDTAATSLRNSLVGLPGDGPTASIEYSNATLVRRSAILAAVEAAGSIASQWQAVTGRARDASEVVALIGTHDQTVLSAAQQGVAGAFADAIPILDQALAIVGQVHDLRVRLIAGTDETVLDQWVERNTAYDQALKTLYAALVKSKGAITIAVTAARREEQIAYDNLPPDRRTIIVIVSEVARGGLTDAVLAIEDVHGSIDDALGGAG